MQLPETAQSTANKEVSYLSVYLRETTTDAGRIRLADAELMEKKLLVRRGSTGRAAFYVLAGKPDINPTNPTPPAKMATIQTALATARRNRAGNVPPRPSPMKRKGSGK